MVEFGLKLEDNKVEEWASKYIDYERLKVLIKKAKRAVEARDSLAQRRPEIAAEVKTAFDAGQQTKLTGQGSFSDSQLIRLCDSDKKLSKIAITGEYQDDAASCGSAGSGSKYQSVGVSDKSEGIELSTHKEESNHLLKRVPSKRYGAQDSFRFLKNVPKQGSFDSIGDELLARSESTVSLTGTLERIKGYFKGNYVSKLADSMKEVDIRLALFSRCLHEEVSLQPCLDCFLVV
mmetsp:Transcript_47140/g.87574  ORF Transcript_47140/g.87574 Transcript_47140/m.87574 type:complete len:234 (-) Transcript_47140:2669-3370(-)